MHIWGNVGEFFQRGKPSLIITNTWKFVNLLSSAPTIRSIGCAGTGWLHNYLDTFKARVP